MLRIVHTSLGDVEGIAAEHPAVTVFRGIPFAAAPVGSLRWRAPQPILPWQGVFVAHDFAPAAMQPQPGASNEFYDKEWGTDPAIAVSEDCLYLNIWTPALQGNGFETSIAASRNLPVMVWIHGGAYQTGCTAEMEFDGTKLARRGVVVVSIAYRLNVFGFLAHSALREEARAHSEDEPFANFGFLDQQAGLKWVYAHIADFGGDPHNITLFGQSAGAGSVLAHICSPTSKGLFHRAILQSGAGLGMFNRVQQSFDDAHSTAERLFASLGIASIEEARKIPAQTLLEAAQALPVPPDSGKDHEWSMMVNWVPCVDGIFITDQFASVIREGKQLDVDVILGNTTGEFMESDADGNMIPIGEIGTLRLTHEWIASGKTAPYYYRFDVALPGDQAGAFHSSELWFTFASLAKCWRPFVGWHFDLARMMCNYWANFARTGNPNGVDCDGTSLATWAPYNELTAAAMHFGRDVMMCEYWISPVERNLLNSWH